MKFEKIYNEDINEDLYIGKSNEGLKVYYIPKIGYNKQFAIFSTNYGSVDNIFKPLGQDEYKEYPEGIAHFLEHKLFEDENMNIFNEYSRLGINVNAFTSFTQTSYLFSSTDNFYRGLELLVEFVQNPYLTDENVEKEKGIIEQEIKMYLDDPSWVVYFNLLDNLYINHPVKIDIAGTVDSIKNIGKNDLLEAYNTFYNPKNMILFVVGDLDFKEIMEAVNKSEKTYTKIEAVDVKKNLEPNKIAKKRSVQKMTVPNSIYHIGFKDIDMNYEGNLKIKKDLASNILLDGIFGSSSKFYNEFYNKGLIDSSFGAYYTGSSDFGHTIIYGEGDDVDSVYEEILTYTSRPLEDIFTEEDFERIKNKNIGQFFMGLNSVEAIATSFVNLYFQDSSLFDFISIMRDINYRDIRNIYDNIFKEELASISIIEPIS